MQALATAEDGPAADKPPPPVAVDDFSPLLTLPPPEKSPVPLQAPSDRWSDWKWHMRQRIRTVDQLRKYFPHLQDAENVTAAASKFPMAITPYYASLIRRVDESDPIFRMSVPNLGELFDNPYLKEDPLEEDEDMPVPGLVHRYQDRALFIATTTCSMYCRHCTRKRAAGQRESVTTPGRLKQAVAYLNEHPEIHDVIISGGDPFTLNTEVLEAVLAGIRSVPTVDIVRIGTRTPVVLPMRITDELTTMLRRYHPLFVNTHFNHPAELTPAASEACGRLADAGIPLGNQTVLLRGVNDSPQTMETLFRGLLRIRVRPYYMFQCDLVRGVEHFRTPIARGIEIMEYLRGRVSGLAIPSFVVDAPHGGGKIPIMPNYIVSSSPTQTVLRNFEGMMVSYPEPLTQAPLPTVQADRMVRSMGVWEVASGHCTLLQPKHTSRERRRRHTRPSRDWQEASA